MSEQGRVAVITGAGRKNGIGAAIARHLAGQGTHVVLGDLCAEPPSHLVNPGAGQWQELQEIARELEGLGVRAVPVRVDVTDAAAVEAVVTMTMEQFGRLDILVNNAGVVFGPAPVAQMQEEAWRKTLEVNATGTFLCSKLALPALMQTAGKYSRARIVNISSLAAIRPKPYMAAYAASKAAVVALTQSLAQEVAQYGITVNAVLPGDIDTGFKRWGLQLESMVRGQALEEVVAAAVGQIPVGRLGLPEDVAGLVAYLCSQAADFVTGQAINVTGGRELVQATMPESGR
ncbi:MAG: SDR family oxidoreductase [Caldilineae bacterium]|nr:MAG: SDR family oxidoreductase [Caldilineae bacterium]